LYANNGANWKTRQMRHDGVNASGEGKGEAVSTDSLLINTHHSLVGLSV